MKLRTAAALVPLSLVLGLLASAPSAAAQDTGWIRWANWAPSCPQVDMYLYPFGNSTAQTVLKHVRYGQVSPYAALPAGTYSIAMRDTGAPPTSPPELSASVRVTPGTAYTIASMGPESHLGVQVLAEKMSSVPGRALVRVVQESLKQHKVTVTDSSRTLGGPLLLGSYTGYLPVSPGWHTISVAGVSDAATNRVFLPANTIHTLVVLDTSGGLRIGSLQDAAGSRAMPHGGIAAGLGGTAPRAPGSSPMPWLAAMAAGGLLAAAGAIRSRRSRAARPVP